MSELTLLALRIGFLVLLWAFVFGIIYALRSDLFGQRVRKITEPAASVQSLAPVRPRTGAGVSVQGAAVAAGFGGGGSGLEQAPTKLVITNGQKKGDEVILGREPITIGRSAESGLIIRDDYTSTHHARLLLWNKEWMIQDLDSTNGTFLDGTRVSVPTRVPVNTPVKIGQTTFELRA
jgi:hypothetical protein